MNIRALMCLLRLLIVSFSSVIHVCVNMYYTTYTSQILQFL